ncbi:MAG TPA: DUF1800 domain-containing protein [Gaiellaceae bacterium]
MSAQVPVYKGPFGKPQAERLLWRAGFGAKAGEADALVKLGLKHAVHALTRPPSYQLVGPAPTADKGRPLSPAAVIGDDHLFWLDKMVRTNAPLVERMTLIWHSWFATSNQGVASQQLMLAQNDFFRGLALGSFGDILTGVTKDPAMLIWLNGNQNVKAHPNENYGREMMELFTLGADRGAYTETDVREQARALTGWTGSVTKGVIGTFAFVDSKHDAGTKTIFGHSGNYTWTDSCTLCLNHPLHSSYFVSKLWSYFIPAPIDKQSVAALSSLYVTQGWRIHPVVEAILQHPAFYSSPRMVTSPVVYNAALLRITGRFVDTAVWWSQSAAAGQQLFYPPDVGGWDFTRWLDTATFRARWFIAALVVGSSSPTDSPSDAAQLVQRSVDFWGTPTLSTQTQGLLAGFAKAQLKRGAAPSSVETALRRLVATSPELQTA